MSRATTAADRLATALTGLLLIAAGVAGILWWSGRLFTPPAQTDLIGLAWLPQQSWWPWGLGALGIILALVGLRWLLAHLPARGVSHLRLPGSDETGTMVVESGPVARAAADELSQAIGVRSARGVIHRDRGQLVAVITATIERDTNLQKVAAAADMCSAHLQHALQRDDLACRVQLHTAGRRRNLPRVH